MRNVNDFLNNKWMSDIFFIKKNQFNSFDFELDIVFNKMTSETLLDDSLKDRLAD